MQTDPVVVPPEPVHHPTDSTFRPQQCPQWIDAAIWDAAQRYNLPRWFLYCIIQRESSFDPNSSGYGDGVGLTQLANPHYRGEPYPEYLQQPDDNNQQYGWDMNFGRYGRWIRMTQVSRLANWRDPKDNLDRFATGHAVPAFWLFKRVYGLGNAETLRAVAFHWNKGVYVPYDPNDTGYLGLYDRYVGEFQGPSEAEDGVWDGQPHL